MLKALVKVLEILLCRQVTYDWLMHTEMHKSREISCVRVKKQMYKSALPVYHHDVLFLFISGNLCLNPPLVLERLLTLSNQQWKKTLLIPELLEEQANGPTD